LFIDDRVKREAAVNVVSLGYI